MEMSLWDVTEESEEISEVLPLSPQNEMYAKQQQLKELSEGRLVWIVYKQINNLLSA